MSSGKLFSRGPLLLVLSACGFAISSVLIAFSYGEISPYEANLYRALFSCILLVPATCIQGSVTKFTNANLSMIFLMCLTTVPWSLSFIYIPPANASTTYAALPVTVSIMSQFFYGRTPKYNVLFGCTLGVSFGLWFTFSKPQDTSSFGEVLFGYFLMFIAMLSYSATTIVQRYKDTDEIMVLFWMYAAQIAIYLFSLQSIPEAKTLMLIFVTAVFTMQAFCCSLWGSAITDPVLTGFIFFLEIPITFFVQMFFAFPRPTVCDAVGIAILLTSVFLYGVNTQADEGDYTEIEDAENVVIRKSLLMRTNHNAETNHRCSSIFNLDTRRLDEIMRE